MSLKKEFEKKFGEHHWSCTKMLCSEGCKFNKDAWKFARYAFGEGKREGIIDLNQWIWKNGYMFGVWIQATKYLEKKYKIKLKSKLK